jgi:hypothetical protein
MTELPSFLAPLGADIARGAATYRRKRRRRERVVALVAAALVAVGTGTAIAAQRGDRTGRVAIAPETTTSVPVASSETKVPSTTSASRQVRVRHQVIESVIDTGGVCDNAIKTSLEVWADFIGDRFRQRVRRDDGIAQEIVVLGPYEYPTARYDTNLAESPSQRCGAELPDVSRSIAFMNPPRRSTNVVDYRELAKPIAGSYVDSRGRASKLYRESDTTGSEWFIDPATGDIQETTVSFLRPDGGRVRVTTTLVSDDEQDVEDTFFDTAGLQPDPSISTDRQAVPLIRRCRPSSSGSTPSGPILRVRKIRE